MEQQNWNKNQLQLNSRNQWEQIKSGRDVEDRCIGDQVENNNAIENGIHFFLLSQ